MKHMKSQALTRATTCRVFNTLIRPVLTKLVLSLNPKEEYEDDCIDGSKRRAPGEEGTTCTSSLVMWASSS